MIQHLFLHLCLLQACMKQKTSEPQQNTLKDRGDVSHSFFTQYPSWNGRITISEAYVLDFSVAFSVVDNTVMGSIAIPKQGVKGLPLEDIKIEDNALSFTFKPKGYPPTMWAKYHFPKSETGSLQGTLQQAGQTFPAVLQQEKLKAKNRPQTPKGPFPYNSKEVQYTNPKDGATLAGTLSIPQGAGPFPVVQLITGSGAQDRDETIFDHKPFWVIADHLTRNGIAVLRVDDRGIGGSTGASPENTTYTFASDVVAGLDFLRTQKMIDPQKMGLIGHSEGGMIAPIVASQRSDVAFLVLLAGPGVNGFEVLVQQNRDLALAKKYSAERVDNMIKAYRVAMDPKGSSEHEEDRARALIRAQLALSDQEVSEEKEQKIVQNLLKTKNAPWIQTFMSIDPASYLQKVQVPVLALNGSLDLQIHADINLKGIEQGLLRGGNKTYQLVKLENHNHMFQHANYGTVEEYGILEETFSPEALTIMTSWIRTTIE